MKKRKVLSLFLLICIISASCKDPALSLLSTYPPVPIEEKYPEILAQNTDLYNGPGNKDFDIIKSLKTDETVYLIGTYGDFLYIQTGKKDNIVKGYIQKNALGEIPGYVPKLRSDSVPWKPFFYPSCSPGSYDISTDSVTFTNESDDYYDTETPAIALTQPLRIKINGLEVKGSSFGAIKIRGIPDSQKAWWKGTPRLYLFNNQGYYRIGVRDGTMRGYNVFWDLPLKTSQTIQIIFEQLEGKSFLVLNKKGRLIKRIDLTDQENLNLPNGLFPEGKAYFGISISPNSSLILSGLNIGELSDGKWVDKFEIDSGLYKLAQKYDLTIGTEFSYRRVNAMDGKYCKTMQRDFNVAVLSEFSWIDLWLGPGQYDFSALDRAIDYAEKQGWRIRASHLVWGAVDSKVIPDWLLNGQFSRDEYIQLLEQHVKTLVNRYKGRVQEWSIANEAASRSLYPGGDFWNDKIGPEYIEMAFRWAKEADPDSILIFNDYNNESPRDEVTRKTIETMVATVKRLKEAGVPIDVVGMQMHLLLKWASPIVPKKEDVIDTMQKFADLGVRIYITEFDVDLTEQKGTQAEKWDFEANLYRKMFAACIESGVCDSFTTWGISDLHSWITIKGVGPTYLNEPDADPLMFDKGFNPKPAYFAVQDVLQNSP